MGKMLVLIHTLPLVLSVFDRLGAELLPEVTRMHLLDEPLLERVKQRGHLAAEDSERLRQHAALAEEIGAGAVLVTCSTISPSVADMRSMVSIPVLTIDEAMIEQAVSAGPNIGVVATAATTLEPTRQMLLTRAQEAGKDIRVKLVLVEEALPALVQGDAATHDRLVKESVLAIMPQVEVVVLAQASMARVLDTIAEGGRTVPVLSSPHLALGRVKTVLGLK